MSETHTDDVVLNQAGIGPDSPLRAVLETRADVLAMTQATHDAALRPRDPGGLTHGERAALATRIARLNREEGLAAHYEAMLRETAPAEETALMADPAFKGAQGTRLAAMIAYTDLASLSPKDAGAGDIRSLKEAGIDDADIVRLAELNAFLAYQIRLVAGLRLMKGRGK
jgi:CMD domain protein